MKIFYLILFLSLNLIISCKPDKPNLDPSSRSAVNSLLTMNQSIHEQLYKSDSYRPEILSSLLKAVSSSRAELKDQVVVKLFTEMETSLTVKVSNKQELFQALSNFSEKLDEVQKLVGLVEEYNKFYCPMENKYWVAKGQTVENPYASDMRECGELVK